MLAGVFQLSPGKGITLRENNEPEYIKDKQFDVLHFAATQLWS